MLILAQKRGIGRFWQIGAAMVRRVRLGRAGVKGGKSVVLGWFQASAATTR
jgi:hypothetical protein